MTKNIKLLKNEIVRKRLRGANFYIKNVKTFKKINYILCIPVNGFTSENIQLIRDGLLKYGYKVDKFTTNSFLSFLRFNDILVEKNVISDFYTGHMMVVTIEKSEKEKGLKKEYFNLNFLFKYILSKNLKYCNLIYLSYNRYNNKVIRTLVINALSKEKNNVLSLQLNDYKKKNISFAHIQNIICNFIFVLLKLQTVILNLFTTYINYKKN